MNGLSENMFLVPWAIPVLTDKGELKKIVDPHLEKNYLEEGVFKYAKLTLRCLAKKPKDRPPSEEVLSTLEQIYMLLASNGRAIRGIYV